MARKKPKNTNPDVEILEAETEPSSEDDVALEEFLPEVLDDVDISLSAEPVESKNALVARDHADIVRYDPLHRYLTDIRRYPLLTPEEEYRLAVHYKETQDVGTARHLVTSNLRLVVKIAMDYQKYWMNLLDLVQEGNVGLMQAVRHYDPYRGVKLSSYASFWIKAYILKFIIDNWSLVKIGTTQAQRKLFFNLKKEKEKYALLGYDPGPSTIAENLNVKPELVVEMEQRMAGGDLSLDQPINADSTDRHIDHLPSKQADIDDQLADQELKELFHTKLEIFRKTLSDKEQYIFEHRLLSDNPETLNEIGEYYGISRERIRQVEERLIKKLKEYMQKEVPELSDLDVTIAPMP